MYFDVTLADQLRARGAEVAFLCADIPGAMLKSIHLRGYVCGQLPRSVLGENALDAREDIKAAAPIMSERVNWVVVDHYQLDIRWEQKRFEPARAI